MSVCASAGVDIATLAAGFLAHGRTIKFSAPGGSMRPTIRGGEVIHVEPVRPAAIAAGDIILFHQGTRIVAHRVVRVAQSGGVRAFLTRGDAAFAADPWVVAGAVMGRVIAVERGGRTVDLAAAGSVWSGRLGRCMAVARVAVRRLSSVFLG